MTPGQKFRHAVATAKPLQIVGTVNAYFALMAERVGHQALYLSGAGVANASYGLPDLGMTSMNDVLIDASRITSATDLPLLVDIDTGWGGAFNIARTIKEFEKARVAAVHMEDQVAQKRCGHRPNKAVVSIDEMCDRIKAAVDARTDESFVIMARTDAVAVEGLESGIERAQAYLEAGADMIFAEALTELDQYRQFKAQVKAPILANMTEFGKTELFDKADLYDAGADMVLYPLGAFRAANAAALKVFEALMQDGHQRSQVAAMQTRAELYDFLGYHSYEDKLDTLFKEGK
ncbi:methylisocitrate lyase [Ferrimonas balearica DSM 9799]|uniref:2-methylisocitrate lyase n=1 Tax=Ferrimonas balearica (strain DSM 9799 / CCM 4581 / KCTC 23876 / PAT) TaxID=550540 RepID=E1SPN6_FERBD|nr:methylisocitrate lyase [Ferrimonas balearica]ADN77853.1 methylisocitrate lyase [Ferrimonas balearica DSM 9799]MBY5982209.1 methylisocitrate lyase [Ferrimonas balearica]